MQIEQRFSEPERIYDVHARFAKIEIDRLFRQEDITRMVVGRVVEAIAAPIIKVLVPAMEKALREFDKESKDKEGGA